MSIGLQFDLGGLERLQRRVERMGQLDRRDLLTQIASLGESQTRRRIAEEQEAPDGTPWAPWSADYAATRHSGQALLQGDGNLVDSITSDVFGDTAEWGSNLVYAAIHQFGGTPDMAPGPAGIPERPYLGLSADNVAEIENTVDEWLDRHLESA